MIDTDTCFAQSGSLDKKQLKNFMRHYLQTQLKDSKEMRDQIGSNVDRVLSKADVTGSGNVHRCLSFSLQFVLCDPWSGRLNNVWHENPRISLCSLTCRI